MISNQPLHASWTPLHFAAEGNQIEAMKLLEASGAEMDKHGAFAVMPSGTVCFELIRAMMCLYILICCWESAPTACAREKTICALARSVSILRVSDASRAGCREVETQSSSLGRMMARSNRGIRQERRM
nr:hypothetical protein CFP56_02760 [Quercus suber]